MFAKAALYTAKQLQYSHTNNSTQMSLMKMKSKAWATYATDGKLYVIVVLWAFWQW